ncbi:uncharacterized protein LOC129587145 [Paramacrobiotus metropolitanus]|uniref:uncharacterized protein LOC129587145 n=1 Tax=Paramacrobiotus metropolitanus TaxID=2943436 RepID=UPI002445B04A|nr:uncharacterized protein LOC129587145 [Paramacrobiotus metropolitanus]
MPLVAYVPDPRRYENVFVSQTGGSALIRYRGTLQNGSGFPQILKNLFAKLSAFAQPILRKAAPHAKAALEAATPHLQEAATGAIKEVASRAGTAIGKRFASQEGEGVRKKRRVRRKVLRVKRIPPTNIPDFL